MRKSIFEILTEKGNVNLKNEIENIEHIIRNIYIHNGYYLYDFIDETIVKDWKYSKRSLNMEDLLTILEITNQDLHNNDYDVLHSLRYIELMYNLIIVAKKMIYRIGYDFDNPKEFERLTRNIKSLLEELNYEIVELEDRYEIIEKDFKATYVAESNTEIAIDIIEYRKYDLKGDLKSKREILQKLAPQVEALRNQFSKTTYKTLMEDTHYLLNNFHIRHNNIDGQYKIEAICNMKDEELEQWYDVTYNNILSVFIIKDYLENKLSIDEIKKIVN